MNKELATGASLRQGNAQMAERSMPAHARTGQAAELAISLLGLAELRALGRMLRSLLDTGHGTYCRFDVLERVRTGQGRPAFKSMALLVNRAAREMEQATSATARATVIRNLKHLRELLAAREEALASPDDDASPPPAENELGRTVEDGILWVYEVTVYRTPAASEIAIWKEHLEKGLPFHEFMLAMSRSPEALGERADRPGLHNVTDGLFVQLAHEHSQNRGAAAPEINHWMLYIESGLNRMFVLSELFEKGVTWESAMASARPHDGLSCRILGTGRDLTAAQWAAQAGELLPTIEAQPQAKKAPDEPRDARYRNRFRVGGAPRVLVSAITSLYRGGRFIEQFMDNITSQEGFDDFCELVIVDADSPEGEAETIRRYMARHRNINYIHINYRIGIYDAWNVAAKAARGAYLTNANLDDIRRADSFMLQAGTLEALPFVDIVYQDLYYTFDPDLPFETIAAFGHQTELPVMTLHNMMQFNSPHNAPMWRKSLHEELGYFDIHFKSAGDHEFWFRCMEAGKLFYKINDPHVVYYQNPSGLSTAPDSRGLREAMEIHRRYARKLMPEEVVMPTPEFLRRLRPQGGGTVPANRYRYAMAQEVLRTTARSRKFKGTAA